MGPCVVFAIFLLDLLERFSARRRVVIGGWVHSGVVETGGEIGVMLGRKGGAARFQAKRPLGQNLQRPIFEGLVPGKRLLVVEINGRAQRHYCVNLRYFLALVFSGGGLVSFLEVSLGIH